MSQSQHKYESTSTSQSMYTYIPVSVHVCAYMHTCAPMHTCTCHFCAYDSWERNECLLSDHNDLWQNSILLCKLYGRKTLSNTIIHAMAIKMFHSICLSEHSQEIYSPCSRTAHFPIKLSIVFVSSRVLRNTSCLQKSRVGA